MFLKMAELRFWLINIATVRFTCTFLGERKSEKIRSNELPYTWIKFTEKSDQVQPNRVFMFFSTSYSYTHTDGKKKRLNFLDGCIRIMSSKIEKKNVLVERLGKNMTITTDF